MARWVEVCEDTPEFAARVQAAFERNKHMTLATVRRDGSPRISGTEIRFEDGDVFVGMMARSLKALDQRVPMLPSSALAQGVPAFSVEEHTTGRLSARLELAGVAVGVMVRVAVAVATAPAAYTSNSQSE